MMPAAAAPKKDAWAEKSFGSRYNADFDEESGMAGGGDMRVDRYQSAQQTMNGTKDVLRS